MHDKEKVTDGSDTSTKKSPLAGNSAPDANVDAAGHCILTQDGEMARPDSGAPCDEGTGA